MATSTRICTAGPVVIGPGRPLTIIAGPCVLESLELGMVVGAAMKTACTEAGLPYIFKASFDKANRSSVRSARGPGIEQGLAWLGQIGQTLGVPTTTDIHEVSHAQPAAEVVDLIQIPAFLCRQTDLLLAAAQAAAPRRRGVNVKKGQFMSPGEMRGAVTKLAEGGCTNVMLTERGTFFGYGRLVNDFIGLGDLMELDAPGGPPPVCFDCTHSTQAPGLGERETTGGRPERAPMLARAAVAAGVHALFMEVHTDPAKAMSDAATQMKPDEAQALVRSVAAIAKAVS